MRKLYSLPALGIAIASSLSGCGGDGNDGYYGGPPPSLVSYVGTTGVFVAWGDPVTGDFDSAPIGSYAGKRQVMHGSLDFTTGANVGQPAGVEVYKASDGHIYGLDLTTFGTPGPQQLSTESAATVDDACSFTGTTAAAGASTDYAGVYFVADLQNATNSSYFYRLPGPDGVCGTADDVVHMVKTGMAPTDAPLVVSAVPEATVRTAGGGISGFVLKSGANLVLTDGSGANPVVLGTFAAPVGVATVLPVGTVQGYPTGQLFIVDGNIVYVNYVAHTTSAALFTIPNWTPTDTAAVFAASPTTLYFAINTPASKTVGATASLYAMPADGSAAPAVVDAEPGRITALEFPVLSANLLFSVANPSYVIRALPVAGGPAVTLVTTTGTGGEFTATANDVYYSAWTATNTPTIITHSGTQSGIVSTDGTVVQAPLANSMFATGGEAFPWPDDTTTTQTPYETVFQITGLSPVTVTDPTTGVEYVYDGVSGGTVVGIDTASNQAVATIGTLPAGTATFLTGTFRGYDDTGFLDATTPVSTQDPATRDLYLLNAQSSMTLEQVTDNL